MATKAESIGLPSTDSAVWGFTYNIGDRVRVRKDFSKFIDGGYESPNNDFTIQSFSVHSTPYREDEKGNNIGGLVRHENPTGRLYYLNPSGSWEGKDLEPYNVSSITQTQSVPISSYKPMGASTSQQSSAPQQRSIRPILVEFGLSKAQISQLPESITAEADFIDGIRQIVAGLTDPQRKAIMEAAIVEAIEIFKNSILEQTEVELTQDQIENINEYTAPESETPEGGQQETPEGGEQETPEGGQQEPPEGGQQEPPEGGQQEPPEDEGGGDFGTQSGGGEGGDEGGGTKQDPDDDDDAPTTTTGGGGGGGGGEGEGQAPIHDEDFSIPDLSEDCKSIYESDPYYLQSNEPTLYTRKKLSFSISEDGKFFWGWTANQWIKAYEVLINCNKPIETGDLNDPNLFSIIKYRWEKYKGTKAKKLDRAFIYLQYFKFLKFFASTPRADELITTSRYPSSNSHSIDTKFTDGVRFPNYISIFPQIYLSANGAKNNSKTEEVIKNLDFDLKFISSLKREASPEVIRIDLVERGIKINKSTPMIKMGNGGVFVDNTEKKFEAELFLTNGVILLRTNSDLEIFTNNHLSNPEDGVVELFKNEEGLIVSQKSRLKWRNATSWVKDKAWVSKDAFRLPTYRKFAEHLMWLNDNLFSKEGSLGIYTLNYKTRQGRLLQLQAKMFFEAVEFMIYYREIFVNLEGKANLFYCDLGQKAPNLYMSQTEAEDFNPNKTKNTFVQIAALENALPSNTYTFRIEGASESDWTKMEMGTITFTPQTPTEPEPQPEPETQGQTKEEIEAEIKGLKLALKLETDPQEKERIKNEIKALKTTLKFL